MAIAGTLEIQMMAGIARLQSDMNQAKSVVGSTMKSIESSVAMAKSALGALGIGLGVGYFASLIKGSIDAQDALSKLSQKINISVEGLAGWQHAADLAGVSNDALTKAFKSLSTQMFDASMGSVESKRNFAALGVQVQNADGTLRSADAVMLEIADKFERLKDGSGKSAISLKYFSKAGLDMIPMLNEGSGAIREMIAEGQRLNPVTAESAKQAEILNDNMTRLKGAVGGVGTEILNKLLGPLASMSEELVKANRKGETFVGLLREAAKIFLSMAGTASKLPTLGGLNPFALLPEGWYERAFAALNPPDPLKLGILGGNVPVVKPKGTLKPPPDEAAIKAAKAAADQAAKEAERLREQMRKDDAESLSKWYDAQKEAEYQAGQWRLAQSKSIEAQVQKAREDNEASQYLAWERARALEVEAGQIRLADIEARAKAESDAIKKQADEFNDLWRTVESTGKSVFVAVFSSGKNAFEGIGKAIKASVIDLLYQITAKKWIINIGTSLAGSLGISGAANAAGGDLLGGVGLLGNLGFGSGAASGMYGAFATSSIGSSLGLSTAGLMGPTTTGAALSGLTALGTAIPYIGAGLAIAGALGLFDGGGGPKESFAKLIKDGAGFGIDVGNVSDAGPSRQSFLAQPGAKALQDALNNPAIYDQAKLAQLVGEFSLGGPASSADAIGALTKALEQAKVSAKDAADAIAAQAELDAQRRRMEIELMELTGKQAEALAAKREDELAALDPTLVALQKQIHAAQDLAVASESAANAISALVDEVSSAVDAQISASRSAASTATSAANSFRQIGIALADAVAKIAGGGRSGAAGRLGSLFGTAMTGNAAALSGLPQAANDFLAASLATSRSSLDFARDQAKVVAMLNQAQIVSEGMVNWNEYQATLLQAQTGVLEAIKAQLEMPSPDAAILTQQMGMLGTIAGLLQDQTTQIVSGNGMQAVLMQDQTGKIVLANALTVDQTGQVALGNSWLGQQATLLAAANTITDAQTGTLLAGSYAVRDGVGNLVNVTVDQAGRISDVRAAIGAGIDIRSAASIGTYLDAVSAAVAGNNTAEAAAVRSSIAVLRQTTADGLIATAEAGPTREALGVLQASTGGLLAQSISVDSAAALQAVERATAIVQATSASNSLLSAANVGQGMIQSLLNGQTAQIIDGNLVLRDQSGLIISSNALLQDQAGKLALGNSLVGTQTGQIITGNAIADVTKNITALNTSYSEQQLAALVASGGVQSDSLTALVTGNAMTVSLLQQLVAMQGAAAMKAYDAQFQEAVGTIWASVQASGGTLADFDAQFAAWKAANPMPSYAVGTSFVPNTGPALLHRGERVLNSAANDELVNELRSLRAEVASMRRDTRKSAETLEAVANGQLAFSTEAA